MKKSLEITQKNREWVAKTIPEHATLDRLILRTDIVILKGLGKLEEIIDTATDNKEVIMANNSLVMTGKFLETRRRNEQVEKTKLVFDDEDLIMTGDIDA